MESTAESVATGDIIEFTIGSDRITAEVMLVSGDEALLDLFDGDRPVLARVDQLSEVAVFHPELTALAA